MRAVLSAAIVATATLIASATSGVPLLGPPFTHGFNSSSLSLLPLEDGTVAAAHYVQNGSSALLMVALLSRGSFLADWNFSEEVEVATVDASRSRPAMAAYGSQLLVAHLGQEACERNTLFYA
ncbi:unnamed protein product [Effrenium voratum]|nr:unnamed protein product [Effrenium voratum]